MAIRTHRRADDWRISAFAFSGRTDNVCNSTVYRQKGYLEFDFWFFWIAIFENLVKLSSEVFCLFDCRRILRNAKIITKILIRENTLI